MKYLNELLEPFQTMILGTLAENGYPFSSYAPFYYDGEIIYVYLSNVATHTKNIQSSPKASSFFIEDESITKNMFKRKRISLQCDVTIIDREDDSYAHIMEAFVAKQGSTLGIFMRMTDFNLYALKPIYGEATFDFGETYNIGGEKMNELVPKK